MHTRTAVGVAVIIIAVQVLLSVWLYPFLPDSLVSHWGAAGEPNGMMPKLWALFLLPLMTACITALLFCVPYLDPLRKNIESFRPTYHWFVIGFAFFMLYIHALTLLWNSGAPFDMGHAITPALGVFFYLLGMLMKKLKRNWFIGIRTPWTLSSDLVWRKTHALGSVLFEAAGTIMVLGAFLPNSYFLWVTLLPILVSTGAVVIYSYLEYKKEKSHAASA